MKIKKYLVCLMAVIMVSSAMVACGKKAENASSNGNSKEADFVIDEDTPVENKKNTTIKKESEIKNNDEKKDTDSHTEETATSASDTTSEKAVQPKGGQAFLAYTNGEEWIRYDGDPVGNPEQNQLAFGAGVADIAGDGTYTVSLNADTDAFRHAVTEDDSDYSPSGVAFMAVVIKDGETLTPDAIITIDKITVDGTEIKLTAKNYTSTEEGNVRANIYNKYVDSPPSDARSTNGKLYDEEGKPIAEDAETYSPDIIDASAIGEWKKMEVTFTVSGLGDAPAVAVNMDDDFSVDDENTGNADSSSDDGNKKNADAPNADDVEDENADFVFE